MLKMNVAEATYFEDGSLLEWFEGTNPVTDRRTRECTLDQAIQFAWKNKKELVIQPEMQDSCLFVDFKSGHENISRKEALKLLIELENAYGTHVGRWLDEFDRDDSSREYLSKMMEIACELQIPFSIDLEEFREFENDCKYELQDRAAAELYYLCQHDLVERLL